MKNELNSIGLQFYLKIKLFFKFFLKNKYMNNYNLME